MNDPAIIKATFVDLRPVKSRGQVQLIFETPIEHADAALEALGGYPQPHEGKWVAIARITEETARGAPEPAEEPKKRLRDEPRSRQMQVMCGVSEFQEFLREKNGVQGWAKEWHSSTAKYGQARYWAKAHLGIESSNELDKIGPPEWPGLHQEKWDALLTEYEQATGRLAEQR